MLEACHSNDFYLSLQDDLLDRKVMIENTFTITNQGYSTHDKSNFFALLTHIHQGLNEDIVRYSFLLDFVGSYFWGAKNGVRWSVGLQ